MIFLDYVVLVAYFVLMAGIGIVCMFRVKHQEDYFLGGRSFGKIMQAFAAFGAGTGADNPVTLGRTVYTSGLSGIWSVLLWLFVTPFYWIFGVWYRRMRHLTLGDWFVERYESRGLGVAYAIFGFFFYMVYVSVGFSAISKVSAPLIGTRVVEWGWLSSQPVPIEYVLVPVIAAVVILYGVLGGLRAAYWTDLIQGFFILLLSVMLIPFGLWQLVERFGDPATEGVIAGFRHLHEQVPAEYFEIVESPRGGEFPLHYIVAITIINLVGIVVQPHFIATGGGSAKTETSARVGLVAGNFMKRFATVGWALTSLIVLALLAGDPQMHRAAVSEPDSIWGIASVEILGPLRVGLVGLMLACLLAALMSSADCYMLVVSALFVRNFWAAYVDRDASEKRYVMVGRIMGFGMIVGAAIVSLLFMDVFDQLKITWEMTILFAAVFWLGMFWRRANRWAAWGTVVFSALFFFILPILLPKVLPGLAEDPRFTASNRITTTTVTREAAPADVRSRQAAIDAWEEARREIESRPAGPDRARALLDLGAAPAPLAQGEPLEDRYVTGGKSVYWRSGVVPAAGETLRVEVLETREDGRTRVEVARIASDVRLRGQGFFNLDFLLYDLLGVDMTRYSNATIETLRLPPKIILPFIVMGLLSLVTRRQRRESLDRFYVKMKTPTRPDAEEDRRELEESYRRPDRFDDRKLLPGSDWEIQRPGAADIIGFVASFAGTFLIIWFTIWVTGIGS